MAPFVADVIAHLPRHLRPTASNGRRLIFVGDVHGMRASLEELLRKVDFRLESEAAEPYEEDGEEEKIARKNEGEGNSAGESKKSRRFRRGDHLILTGDMVNKGPGTVGLVSLLRSLGASAVRGNHEDRVLRAAISEGLLPHHGSKKHQKKKKKKKNKTGAEVDSTPSTAGDEVELGQGTVVATSLQPSATEEAVMVDDASQSSGSSSSHGASTVDDEVREARRRADIVVAHALGKENLVWLSRLPVILRLGSIPSTAVPGFGKLDSEEQLNDDGGQHQESQQRQHRLGEVVVVHAGLVPGVRLSQQDPWAVMNMRSLVHATSSADAVDREGNIDKGGDENVDADADVDADVDPWSLAPVFQPVHTREGTNWARQWDRWQERLLRREERRRRRPLRDVGDIDQIALKQDHLPPDRALAASTANVPRAADHSSAYSNHPAVPMTVVYGHDSKRGLRVGAWTLGLDTGCVAGGRLTALVISGGEGKREVTHRLVSVDCRAEAAEWERIKAASKAASVWK